MANETIEPTSPGELVDHILAMVQQPGFFEEADEELLEAMKRLHKAIEESLARKEGGTQ